MTVKQKGAVTTKRIAAHMTVLRVILPDFLVR